MSVKNLYGAKIHIPEELVNSQIWKATRSKDDKAPATGKKGKLYALPTLMKKYHDRFFGTYIPVESSKVIVDIDKMKRDPESGELLIPTVVRELLKKYPTYVEVSKSGLGLHIAYKVTGLDKNEYATYKYFNTGDYEGEVRLYECFTIFTNDPHELSDGHLGNIPLEALQEIFPFKVKASVDQKTEDEYQSLKAVNYSVEDLSRIMKALPVDQNDRIRRIYEYIFGEPYSHYDYWTKVGMALYDATNNLNELGTGLQLYIDWSRKDEASFVNEDDVLKHWHSFEGHGISYKTLFKLESKLTIHWPDIKVRNKQISPVQGSPRNLKALLDFYDVSIEVDESSEAAVRITGDQDILSNYFYTKAHKKRIQREVRLPEQIYQDELQVCLFDICMDHGLPMIPESVIRNTVRSITGTAKSYHPVRNWIDQREYKEGSPTWQNVADTLVINDDFEHAKPFFDQLVKKFLMQIVKNFYYEGSLKANAGMLILSGPSGTYKTTWTHHILPPPYNEVFITDNTSIIGQSVDRDILMSAKSSMIINFDEFEMHLREKRSVGHLKQFLTSSTDTYRGLYQKAPRSHRRNAVAVGTTNSRTLPLPPDGVRRFWIVPVKLCDTTELFDMDLQQVYADLKAELLALPPKYRMWAWNLSPVMQRFIETYLYAHKRAETLTEAALLNCFNWNYPWKDQQKKIKNLKSAGDIVLKTTKEVVDMLETALPADYTEKQRVNIRRDTVELLLKYCTRYTNSLKKVLVNKWKGAYIKNGQLNYGGSTKWCMPPFNPDGFVIEAPSNVDALLEELEKEVYEYESKIDR
jgi:hypothetical protein